MFVTSLREYFSMIKQTKMFFASQKHILSYGYVPADYYGYSVTRITFYLNYHAFCGNVKAVRKMHPSWNRKKKKCLQTPEKLRKDKHNFFFILWQCETNVSCSREKKRFAKGIRTLVIVITLLVPLHSRIIPCESRSRGKFVKKTIITALDRPRYVRVQDVTTDANAISCFTRIPGGYAIAIRLKTGRTRQDDRVLILWLPYVVRVTRLRENLKYDTMHVDTRVRLFSLIPDDRRYHYP